MPTEGKKTTEFWAMVVANVLLALAGLVGYLPPELTAKIIAGLVTIYTVARVVVKLTPTQIDDKALGKLAELIKKLGGIVPENK